MSKANSQSQDEKTTPPETSAPSLSFDLQESAGTLFLALDQKIEQLRGKSDQIQTLQHQRDLNYEQTDKSLSNTLHEYHLQMKELESSLQYLSHKTQLQMKEMENMIHGIQRDTQMELKDIHFKCREDISGLSRRLETLEKLLL